MQVNRVDTKTGTDSMESIPVLFEVECVTYAWL